jgi:pilus assembly protein Flp/PilA
MSKKPTFESAPPSTSLLRAAMALAHRFVVAEERGATAIEYALVASGIAGAIITIVFGMGSQIQTTLYNRIAALM